MTLNEYQEQAKKTAVYPGNFRLIYLTLAINGETGEFTEHLKKAIRDDGYTGEWPDNALAYERRELMVKELGDILWYLAMLCTELGTTLDAVAEINIAKLQARKDSNNLKGLGDNR